MTSPAKTTATAPVNEIGYQQAVGQYMWWLYENETTPELIWPQSVYVYDQMRRTDAQVGSVLRAVTLPVLRTPWRVDPAGARDEVVELIADDLGLPIVGKDPVPPARKRDRFSWQEHLSEALLMLPIGYSYFEQVYRIDPDGSKAHLRKLALRPARTIEYVNVASDGGLVSIKQYWIRSGERPQPIPVDRLVAYIHAKEGGNWLGTSILRNCYKNWLLKDRLLRVQAQTIERNGMGIPLYKGQEGAPDLTTGLAMAKAWRAGDAAGTAIPFGADLVLRGVEGTLPDAEPAIRYHDEQIARAVLAHFLNLGTQTGSWALGTTFADFFTLSLQTLAQQIADVATSHVVEDLVDINFGESEPSPRIVFDEIGSRQAATAQALKLLIDTGVIHPDDILEQSTRQQYGLPPRDPNAPPPGPLPGLVRETLRGTATGDGVAPAPADTGSPVKAAGEPDPKDGAFDEPDDDDWDLWIEVLAEALSTFSGEVAASFDEAKHLRNPAGGKGGGRFRSMFDRITDQLTQWSKGQGPDKPLAGFDREQLRRVAVKRGVKLRRGASHQEISDALLADMRVDVTSQPKKADTNAGKPVRFTLHGQPDPAKVREVEVENRIREAYAAVLARRADSGNRWVGLADIRDELGESLNRHEVDAALRRLERADGVNIVPESNQKTLTQTDRDAAVVIGDQQKHAITMDDPSPRPLPTSHRNTDVGVYTEANGKVSLWEVSDNGERHRRIALADDLAGLEAWANQHGESELAGWARTEQGSAAPAVAGATPVEQLAARIGEAHLSKLGGVSGSAKLATFPGGEKLVVKQYGDPGNVSSHSLRNADAEELGAQVVAAFGVRVPETVRTSEGGLAIEHIDGPTAAELGYTRKDMPQGLVDSPEGRRLGLADLVLGNTDRGDKNLIISDGLVAIDQGHSFGGPLGFSDTDVDDPRKWSAFSQALLAPGGGWGPTGMSADELATIRARIEALRPEFERRDRLKWHDKILARFDAAANAGSPTKAPPAKAPAKRVPRKAAPVADLTGAGGLSSDPAVRETQIENRIRAAYNELPKGADIWLGFADLREHASLRDIPRAEVDAALLRGVKRGDMQIEPFDNRRGMGQRDRDAALHIGGDPNLPREMIHYRSPDGNVGHRAGPAPLLPLPKGATKRAPAKVAPSADLTGAGGFSDDPAVREVQVENRVRQAYVDGAAQAQGLEGWVGLADLRERLSDLSREEQNAALTKMLFTADYNDPGRVRIIPVANTKALKPRDRAAALRIGMEDSHAIWIGDPALRPLPDSAVKKAAPAKTATKRAPAKPPAAPSTPDATLADLRALGSHDEAWAAASKLTVPQLKAALTRMGHSQGLAGQRKGALVDRLAGTWPEMRVDTKPAAPAQPTPPALGYAARQAALLAPGGQPIVRGLEGGVSAQTDLLTYPDGSRVIRKTYRPDPVSGKVFADSEELAARVLDVVGVRAPAVARLDFHTLAMEFVDGEQGGPSGVLSAPAAVRNTDEGRLLGLADALMGNRDRNQGNWMRTPDGHLVAIDHGGAFLTSEEAAAGNPFASYLLGSDSWTRENDLDPAALASLRAELESLKPDFDRLGRRVWYDRMIARLDEIQRRAKGRQLAGTWPVMRVDTPTKPAPARKAVPKADGGQGPSDLAAAVAQHEPQVVRTFGNGAGAVTELVQLGDRQAVRKTLSENTYAPIPALQQAHAETLAASLAHAVGLPGTPAVHQSGDAEVFMDYREGVHASDSPFLAAQQTGSEQGKRMALLDAIMANTDRHGENWLIGDDGNLVPIDHAAAFEFPADPTAPHYRNETDAFAHHLFTGGIPGRWRDGVDYSRAELSDLRASVAALRDEFAASGRIDWYEAVLARIDHIATLARNP